MSRRSIILLITLALVLSIVSAVYAQEDALPDRAGSRGVPAGLEGLKLAEPLQMDGIDAATIQSGVAAEGDGSVIIRLVTPSVSEQKVRGKSAEHAKNVIEAEQADLLGEILAMDPNARVLGQVQVVMNAIFVEVDAAVLPALADNPAVQRIAPVANYEMDLSETVPYIGASAVQNMGYDGSGVRVAVLDSGIDYYHAALGGSGNARSGSVG